MGSTTRKTDAPGAGAISAEEAYRRCEEITWAQARNFAYGIRLLPAPKRRAMAALYAMARRIDDVGDGTWPHDRKLAALDDLHGAIAELEAGRVADVADPVLVGVADAAERYPIPVGVLHEIVEGCEQDVRGQTYATMDDTVRYCRLVAGSVGRLSLGVFGTKPNAGRSAKPAKPAKAAKPAKSGRFGGANNSGDSGKSGTSGPSGESSRSGHSGDSGSDGGEASRLADDLGVALQLTNILRDIREDHSMGRIYLPSDERERFGVLPGQWAPPDSVAALVQSVAGQAAGWFDRGLMLLGHLDHRSRACTAAMAGIYRRLLRRLAAQPTRPLAERVRLPTTEKALVAVRSLAGLRP